MSRYTEFFLKSDSDVVQLELIEISHPAFSKVYRVVRNAINGVTVTLEDSSVATFDYYPLQITPTGASDDLDQNFKVMLGDLGELIPLELDAVHNADSFDIKPVLLYRTYRADDLTQPLLGPVKFQVMNIAFTKEGATVDAGAPKVNQVSTGELYAVDRFPMLRGFM